MKALSRLAAAALSLPVLSLFAGCGTGAQTTATSTRTTTTTTPTPATPTPIATCVTFIGDSLTAHWPMSNFTAYDGGCYLNHGIGGTNLDVILELIDDPVTPTVDPATSRVVVVGGDAVNSINTPLTMAQMEADYTQILAKLSKLGVQPVLCTLLPTSLPASNAQIVVLNAWLRATAATQNIPLFDLYAQPGMVAADGTLSTAVSSDGTHISIDAYAPFTVPVEADIRLAAAKAGL